MSTYCHIQALNLFLFCLLKLHVVVILREATYLKEYKQLVISLILYHKCGVCSFQSKTAYNIIGNKYKIIPF